MRKELVIATLVSIALLAIHHSNNQAKTDLFGEWKAQYGPNWAPEEESFRRLIFEKNLVKIEKHNADDVQTYKMGVNQFTIFSDEEFAAKYLTPMKMVGYAKGDDTMVVNGDTDWSTSGKVSKIKNQGQCGSCWAFSATGALESFSLFKGASVSLSEQQLVDCSRPQGNQGCNGGWPSSALKYVISKGIASEDEYSYVAKDQACKKDGGSFKISAQTSFPGCNGISNAITAHPLSVTVDAEKWSAYKSGVFSNCGSSIDHAVLLVGIVGGNWKIKNSWGTTWGEAGYIRLASGNTCGLCQYAAVYPQ